MKLLQGAKNIICGASHWFGMLACFICYFITFVVLIDVLGRYLFNHPIQIVMPMVTNLLPVLAYLVGGYLVLYNGHVRLDLFYEKYPPRVKKIVDTFVTLIALAWVGVIIWQGYELAVRAYRIDAFVDEGFQLPLYLFYGIVPVGGIISFFQIIVSFFSGTKNLSEGIH